MVLLGSIASYQYSGRSDIDVHCVVDLQQLSQLEYNGGVTAEQAHDVLDELRTKINKSPEKLPGTDHPLEVTFHYKGYETPRMPVNVGMYDLVADKWTSPPKGKDLSPVAGEKLYPEMVDAVYGLAHKYDVNLGQMRRDIVDVQYLREALSQFPPKYRAVIEKDIQAKIDALNAEITDYEATTKGVTDERKSGPYPVMPAELQMKFLARYGYLWLWKQFKELGEVEESDLPGLSKDINDVPKLQ
jgi:hypothetical protein